MKEVKFLKKLITTSSRGTAFNTLMQRLDTLENENDLLRKDYKKDKEYKQIIEENTNIKKELNELRVNHICLNNSQVDWSKEKPENSPTHRTHDLNNSDEVDNFKMESISFNKENMSQYFATSRNSRKSNKALSKKSSNKRVSYIDKRKMEKAKKDVQIENHEQIEVTPRMKIRKKKNMLNSTEDLTCKD